MFHFLLLLFLVLWDNFTSDLNNNSLGSIRFIFIVQLFIRNELYYYKWINSLKLVIHSRSTITYENLRNIKISLKKQKLGPDLPPNKAFFAFPATQLIHQFNNYFDDSIDQAWGQELGSGSVGIKWYNIYENILSTLVFVVIEEN